MYLSKLPNVFVCLNNQTVSSCKLSHCMCRPQIAVSSPLPDISIWPPKTHPPHSRQLAECIYLKKMSTCIGLIIANVFVYLYLLLASLPDISIWPSRPPLTQDTTWDCLGPWGSIQIPTSKITLPVELWHLKLMKSHTIVYCFHFLLVLHNTNTKL